MVAYNGVISGTKAVTQAGPGMLVFNGNHTYTGLTTISAGTLQIGSGGSTRQHCRQRGLAGLGKWAVATLAFARSDTVTYGGSVSWQRLSAPQQGPGNLILTGSKYAGRGGCILSGGTVTVGSDANPWPGGPSDLQFFGRHLGCSPLQ